MKFDFGREIIWESLKIAMISIVASVSLTFALVLVVVTRYDNFWEYFEIGLYIAGLVAFCVGFPVANIVLQQNRSLKLANEKLNSLIRYDQLTGLLSRATFFDEVEVVQTQRRDENRFDAVFFMDLDHFKNINDQHGHAAGDEVLRNFGTLVNRQLQKDDLAGRLGGEEFAIFIPNCTPDEANDRAEHLAQSFSDRAINIGETEIRCTVSIGVFVENGSVDLDAMLSQADELLYKAKQTGRNRVVSGEISRLAA